MPTLKRNIELKARIGDIDAAMRTARELATEDRGMIRHVDTYFKIPKGRLKLRVTGRGDAELIWYQRPDETGTRLSQYTVHPVNDPDSLKTLLTSAFGLKRVVDKNRYVFMHESVRIHIDSVSGLGEFIELEALLDRGGSEDEGREKVLRLAERFGVTEGDLLGASYSDMLE